MNSEKLLNDASFGVSDGSTKGKQDQRFCQTQQRTSSSSLNIKPLCFFLQACAFLNTYLHLRGRCQESYYNLGRAMHQLGLLPAALHYYKKALDLEAAVGPGQRARLDY